MGGRRDAHTFVLKLLPNYACHCIDLSTESPVTTRGPEAVPTFPSPSLQTETAAALIVALPVAAIVLLIVIVGLVCWGRERLARRKKYNPAQVGPEPPAAEGIAIG